MVTRLGVRRVETVGNVQIASAKSRNVEGASHHAAFMDNCPSISHMC